MITVTINDNTRSVSDIRGYTKILEKEYLQLDAKYKALQEQLKPVAKFFSEDKSEPKKRISKTSALELAIEEQEKIIQMKAMKKVKGLK